jgi:hypothetical protein|tara:strand:- start:2651 stop:2872 length:222 start_codon:yes stop_codon:yes gene_type:complete
LTAVFVLHIIEQKCGLKFIKKIVVLIIPNYGQIKVIKWDENIKQTNKKLIKWDENIKQTNTSELIIYKHLLIV